MKRGRPIKWNLCKRCGIDITKTGESQITHMNKHGYNFGRTCELRQYFTSAEYL